MTPPRTDPRSSPPSSSSDSDDFSATQKIKKISESLQERNCHSPEAKKTQQPMPDQIIRLTFRNVSYQFHLFIFAECRNQVHLKSRAGTARPNRSSLRFTTLVETSSFLEPKIKNGHLGTLNLGNKHFEKLWVKF